MYIADIDVNATNTEGLTALMCAAKKDHQEVVGVILGILSVKLNSVDCLRGGAEFNSV